MEEEKKPAKAAKTKAKAPAAEEAASEEPKAPRVRKRITRVVSEDTTHAPNTAPVPAFEELPIAPEIEAEIDIPVVPDEEIDMSDLLEEVPDITDEDLGISEEISKEQALEAKRKDDYSKTSRNSSTLS